MLTSCYTGSCLLLLVYACASSVSLGGMMGSAAGDKTACATGGPDMHCPQQAQPYIEAMDNSQQRERIDVAPTREQCLHER